MGKIHDFFTLILIHSIYNIATGHVLGERKFEGYWMTGEFKLHAEQPSKHVPRDLETPRKPLSALEREEIRLQLAARRYLDNREGSTQYTTTVADPDTQPGKPAVVDWGSPHAQYSIVPASVKIMDEPNSAPVWRIELHVAGGGRTVPLRLDIARDAVIGRSVGAGNPVDVNLEPYGAFEQGVSRRHAMLHPSLEALYLVDLHSTNGTLHNNVRLGPGVACLLKDDDTLSFGGLTCTVKIIGQLHAANLKS